MKEITVTLRIDENGTVTAVVVPAEHQKVPYPGKQISWNS